jgi:lipopolysaccharide export LptBFGC system permease protein LptF
LRLQRKIGFGVASGVIAAGAIALGFDVPRTAGNLGVLIGICVGVALALVQLINAPSYPR